MVWRALFAARSPPRLRRWRWVRPEEAGIGATPARCANPPSEHMRSGYADTGRGQQLASLSDQRAGLRIEFGDLRVHGLVAGQRQHRTELTQCSASRGRARTATRDPGPAAVQRTADLAQHSA